MPVYLEGVSVSYYSSSKVQQMIKSKKHTRRTLTVIFTVLALLFPLTATVSAVSVNPASAPLSQFALSQCGSKSEAVPTSINFGCTGAQCISNPNSAYCQTPHSGIVDLTFAIIRFLTDGVGLVLIASLVIAGIQYTTSRGEPQAMSSASKRIQSTLTALFVYLFIYAILNYVVPSKLFGQ